jgi:hypothetical protein
MDRTMHLKPWAEEYSRDRGKENTAITWIGNTAYRGQQNTADIMDRRKQLPQWTGNKADTVDRRIQRMPWTGEYNRCHG